MKIHPLCVAVALGPLASLLVACGNDSGSSADVGGGGSFAAGGAGASAVAGAAPAGSGGSVAGDTSLPTAGAAQGGTGGDVAIGGDAGAPSEAGVAQGGASGGGAGKAGLDPTKPPGQNFDLSRFTLQLPTDKANPGVSVDQIKQPALAMYSSIYFYTDTTDGGMTFWCPDNGAHTGNTHYARTELRENAVGGDWQITATASLSATFKVTKLPKTKSVIIGQIHGNATDGTGEALKLEYGFDNSISAVFEQNSNPANEDPKPLGKYTLGEKLSYSISLAKTVLTVTITNAAGTKKTATTTYNASSWTKDTYYFKLGDYDQENTGGSTDGGRVVFYAFDVVHQ